MPSMGIYSYELFHTYDVDNIIRVGSVGSISPRLKLRDVVLGQAACTDSNYPSSTGWTAPSLPSRTLRCWRAPCRRPAAWA